MIMTREIQDNMVTIEALSGMPVSDMTEDELERCLAIALERSRSYTSTTLELAL